MATAAPNYQSIADAWLNEDKAVLDKLRPEERRALGLIAAGVPADEQMEAAGSEFVLGVKETTLFRRGVTLGGAVKADGDDDEPVLRWTFSDETPDRAGDIIRQSWDLKSYRKNPVILWGHAMGFDSDADIPIGRGEGVTVADKSLVGTIRFASEDERSMRIYKLAKAGFVNAGSVGFRPLKAESPETEEERAALGLGRFGVVFTRSELLEFSLVSVPANPNALQAGIKSGAITEKDADFLADHATERDWEKAVRRRARSYVTVPGAAVDESPGGDARSSASPPVDGDGGAHSLAAAIESLSKAVAQLTEQRAQDAESRSMLAKAITNLSGRVGASRAADAARSGADANGRRGWVPTKDDLKKIRAALKD